jgi:predicted  nucleic acid-binding Zn-ribbon protein
VNANYSRKRYYTKSYNAAESNAQITQELLKLRKQVEELTKERDRLRGSYALLEAELARLHKWYEGACLEIKRITGGV